MSEYKPWWERAAEIDSAQERIDFIHGRFGPRRTSTPGQSAANFAVGFALGDALADGFSYWRQRRREKRQQLEDAAYMECEEVQQSSELDDSVYFPEHPDSDTTDAIDGQMVLEGLIDVIESLKLQIDHLQIEIDSRRVGESNVLADSDAAVSVLQEEGRRISTQLQQEADAHIARVLATEDRLMTAVNLATSLRPGTTVSIDGITVSVAPETTQE